MVMILPSRKWTYGAKEQHQPPSHRGRKTDRVFFKQPNRFSFNYELLQNPNSRSPNHALGFPIPAGLISMTEVSLLIFAGGCPVAGLRPMGTLSWRVLPFITGFIFNESFPALMP
jgi:hypothetical protein